jgi:hypothetical protein
MNLIDYIKNELVSSPIFENDKDIYLREQIYARIISYTHNPNRYYSDLNILHDELYNFRCFVFDISQDDVKIHIVLIGYFNEKFTHFCNVIIRDNKNYEYEQIINWDEIKNILNMHLDYNKNINIYGFKYTKPKNKNITFYNRY